jgi:hypothetical protein
VVGYFAPSTPIFDAADVAGATAAAIDFLHNVTRIHFKFTSEDRFGHFPFTFSS